MKKKINFIFFISSKKRFIAGQILIFVIGVAVIFFSAASHHQAGVLEILSAKLDAMTESIANQLRSNQAPNVPVSDEYRIFIINVSDGAVVVDRQSGDADAQRLWESRRTKFIYEMQKQKRGWIVYPEKIGLGWNQKQKLIRYVPIDEMGWILALETSKPSGFELLKNIINASSYGMILLVLLLGSAGFLFLTNSYLNRIQKTIANTAEDNLLYLSGEGNFWDKSQSPPSSQDANLEKEIMGAAFEPVVTKPKVEEPKTDNAINQKDPIEDIRDEGVVRFSDGGEAVLEKKIVPLKEEQLIKKDLNPPSKQKQEPSNIDHNQPVNDSAINVNGIKSSALKKMIQQLREK